MAKTMKLKKREPTALRCGATQRCAGRQRMLGNETLAPPSKGQDMDQEFYDSLDRFVEGLVISLPASYDGAIAALEAKAADLRKKIGEAPRTSASDVDPTAGADPNFRWDGNG